MNFKGVFQHSVDAKGRLFLPAKLRDGLGPEPVVTKGLDGCLFVFSKEGWEAYTERLLSTMDPYAGFDERKVARSLFAGANDLEFDSQGRVLIPGNLRQYAGIDRDVVVAGVGNRVEIWPAAKWEEYSRDADADFPNAIQRVKRETSK